MSYISQVTYLSIMRKRKDINGLTINFCLFTEQVIAGLDRAVMTMKKGELGLLTIKPEYGFGIAEVKRDLAVVPPCSTIIYEVEMLDFTRVSFRTLEAYVSLGRC